MTAPSDGATRRAAAHGTEAVPAITVLDGGMSRELMRLGAAFRMPEWSAVSLWESPELVERAHREFAAAGAEVLTTNSYAVVPFHLGAERFGKDGFELAQTAAQLARSAADEAGCRVAGCVPPPFGSYVPEAFDADAVGGILSVLVEAQRDHVDLWLAETLSSVDELEAAAAAVAGTGLPLWVSFTAMDTDGTRLRGGSSLAVAGRRAVELGASAVCVNCTQPEATEVAVQTLVGAVDVPVGAYANVLDDHVPAEGAANEVIHDVRLDATAAAYCDWVERWISAGATLVGGCCGTDARHITAVSNRLRSIG